MLLSRARISLPPNLRTNRLASASDSRYSLQLPSNTRSRRPQISIARTPLGNAHTRVPLPGAKPNLKANPPSYYNLSLLQSDLLFPALQSPKCQPQSQPRHFLFPALVSPLYRLHHVNRGDRYPLSASSKRAASRTALQRRTHINEIKQSSSVHEWCPA
jgi:hypothetical protein